MGIFSPAKKTDLKLRLGLTGPSGSGKTYSALLLAKAICPDGRIAVIDTENGSANLYSDKFEFDIAAMNPPYSVEKYLMGMDEAADAYDILIIDSLSHAWAGEGGVLDRKAALDKRGGNSFTNWNQVTPLHEKLKNAILHPKTHLICTMRVKQDYVLEQDDKGKSVPKKVGLAPVQREGMEYEFDVLFDLAMDHGALASKDRTSLFSSQYPFPVDAALGEKLRTWLNTADNAKAPIVKTNAKQTTKEIEIGSDEDIAYAAAETEAMRAEADL